MKENKNKLENKEDFLNNNNFIFESNNIIQKNKEEDIDINQMQKINLLKYSYLIQSAIETNNKLLNKNFQIMNEKLFNYKNYLLNNISLDILNLNIKEIIKKLEEIKKNSQTNGRNLQETNELVKAIQSVKNLENFK
jgi:hypothetical protein